MRRIHLHIITALLGFSARAQVVVDKPIVLEGPTSTERQVTGLFPDTTADRPITAGVEQGGQHRSGAAIGGAGWSLDVPALNGAPSAGTHLVVTAPDPPGAGPLQISVNGTGPYPVLIAPGSPFIASSAVDMPALSLVFDGTAFQVMNGRNRQRRECPAGMATVNDQYCIDISETDTTDFFTAGRDCVTQNKRLCSWGEWYGACNLASTLGLQNMTDNWEWTNNTANEDNGARIVGPGCSTAGTWGVFNEPQRYRCCYTR